MHPKLCTRLFRLLQLLLSAVPMPLLPTAPTFALRLRCVSRAFSSKSPVHFLRPTVPWRQASVKKTKILEEESFKHPANNLYQKIRYLFATVTTIKYADFKIAEQVF